MLGRAADRHPYSKSYISRLVRAKMPITPRVDHAARILMVSLAGLQERAWIDPLPTFEGGPVEQLKRARESGVSWQDVYARDADVRTFVDTLVEIISRG